MGEQNVVYPYIEILFSNKKEQITDTCYRVDELEKHYAKWWKPNVKDHISCDSICMKCPEKPNL